MTSNEKYLEFLKWIKKIGIDVNLYPTIYYEAWLDGYETREKEVKK
jgi:hypothetical protein